MLDSGSLSVKLGFLKLHSGFQNPRVYKQKCPGFRNLYSLTWGEMSHCARGNALLMGRRRLQVGGWCGEGIWVLQQTGKAADMLTSFQFVEASISSLISSFSRLLSSNVSILRPVIYRLSMSFRYIVCAQF